MGPDVVAHQLTPDLGSDHKYLLAVSAWHRAVSRCGTCGQLHRLVADLPQEASLFPNRPDVRDSAPLRLEKEILAIGCPTAAALVGRIGPSGKNPMEIFPVCCDLPK